MRRFQPNYSLRLNYVPCRKYTEPVNLNASDRQSFSKTLNKHGENLEKNADVVAKKLSNVLQGSIPLLKVVNTETEIVDKFSKRSVEQLVKVLKEAKSSEDNMDQLTKLLKNLKKK